MVATTELEHAAAEAWALVVRERAIFDVFAHTGPMPPGIALDRVQDVCGDRDDAVTALLKAAGRWLAERVPTKPAQEDEFDSTCRANVEMVTHYIEAESFLADVYLSHVGDLVKRINDGIWAFTCPHALLLDSWRLWVVDARRVIELCRAVIAAAHQE